MRIVFLGSSHGVPEQNRRTSCTLLEVGERRYMIDMGTQAIEQLITRGIAPDAVQAVFVTHMHGDHTNGLISFLDLGSWYFKTVDPALYLPGDPEAIMAAAYGWLAVNGTQKRPYRAFAVEEGLLYDDGFLRVTAYRTRHTAASFAYLVEAEGKRILFSGDLSHKPQEDFPYAAFPLDLAICEVAHFEATAYLSIFTGEHIPGRVCFNHYNSARRMAGLCEARAALEIPTLLATDGLEIVL